VASVAVAGDAVILTHRIQLELSPAAEVALWSVAAFAIVGTLFLTAMLFATVVSIFRGTLTTAAEEDDRPRREHNNPLTAAAIAVKEERL
jgi:hypothetical protein